MAIAKKPGYHTEPRCNGLLVPFLPPGRDVIERYNLPAVRIYGEFKPERFSFASINAENQLLSTPVKHNLRILILSHLYVIEVNGLLFPSEFNVIHSGFPDGKQS
ncbi:MAG: hypothetical protein M1148_01190 [Candidatus Thermoplasmatota archaeon]|nr:hypothetical protein [Candidatus Thermoplasmatota archaeon]